MAEAFKISNLADTSEATVEAVSASVRRLRDDELDGLGNSRMRK